MVSAKEFKWKSQPLLKSCKYISVETLKDNAKHKKGDITNWSYHPRFEEVLIKEEEKGELKILKFLDKNEKEIEIDISELKKYNYVKEQRPEIYENKGISVVNENVTDNTDVTRELKEEAKIQEIEGFKEGEISWLPQDSFFNTWDNLKGHMKRLFGHKSLYVEQEWKKFFLAVPKDKITGKPQLVNNVQVNLPLIRHVLNKKKNKENIEDNEEIEIQSFFFFDEHFDKRHDGFQKDVFALDFRLYRVIESNQKEYFILSQTELPSCSCEFNGMIIPTEDVAELNRNLKLKSISKLFLVKDFIPAVKILSKEQIVTFTKERKINLNDWLNYLAYHPQGSYNLFPEEFECLKGAFLLSGKVDGYPMHLFIMGKAGTNKSMGIVETTANLFSNDFKILEGGNSRVKALVPSFKEKPANLGYLLKAERVGIVDEIGKMLEFEFSKHESNISNLLGECNFILEHRKRVVGSGNDNDIVACATSKNIIVSNPVANKRSIYDHIGLIDPTFLSRNFIWIQDNVETELHLSKKSVLKVSPTPSQEYSESKIERDYIENRKKYITLKNVLGEICNIINNDEFLTLFDSCFNFCSNIDDLEVEKLTNTITLLAKEPMKSSVWKPRGIHHVKLLIDGLCKMRCLFEDYDSTFTANNKDFERAEKILIRMVNGWDTNLSPKENQQ